MLGSEDTQGGLTHSEEKGGGEDKGCGRGDREGSNEWDIK